MFWVHVVVVPVSLITAAIIGFASPPALLSAWWPVVIVSASYVIAYALQILALRLTSAVQAGLFFNLEPIMTGLVAAAFVGERLQLVQYAGAMMVVAALVMAGSSPQRVQRN